MFVRTHRAVSAEPDLPPADSQPPLEPLTTRFDKYSLFETASTYYLIGSDRDEKRFKVLKLNRCVPKPERLSDVLCEDRNVYSKPQITDMLHMINEGNKSSGGLSRVCEVYGLIGFVKFLDCYYFTVISGRKKVGCIAHNDIYAIKSTEVFALQPQEKMNFSLTNVWNKMMRNINRVAVDNAEVKYLGLFQFIDLSKDFFFSYTYDLTHSLQHNYMSGNNKIFPQPPYQEMFEWGHHQSAEIRAVLGDAGASYWVLPIIHGSFQQRRFDLLGQSADLVLIARRSRHYAGTRYLKRGISVHGRVANDCEMEQILQVNRGLNSTFASHVQMRGSIPTYWYQETSVTMPKPPILVNRIDPNYKATQDHFANLMLRYGAPIVVLDLVKQTEKRKRESIIGKEFRDSVEVINATICDDKKIRYIALDFSRMSRAAKLDSKKEKVAQSSRTGAEWSNFEQNLGNQIKVKEGNFGNNAASRNSNSVAVGGKRWGDSFSKSNSSSGPDRPSYNRKLIGHGDPTHSGADGNVSAQSAVGGSGAGTTSAAASDPTAASSGNGSKLDVLNQLKKISQWAVHETSFFCSTTKSLDRLYNVIGEKRLERAKRDRCLLQNGALRTNCIDCLDRTNVAQFATGASFLSIAMVSLGLLPSINDEVPSGLLLGLMDLYSELGDRIALQYGGSEAHKKVAAGDSKGAEGSKAPSKQAELLTSIKRYYSNAFTDRLKQDAMNLFLGYFIPKDADSPLWELENDYALHNTLLIPPESLSNIILYNIDSYIRYYSGKTLRLRLDASPQMLENVLRPSAKPEDLLRFFEYSFETPSSNAPPEPSALDTYVEKQLKAKMDDFINITQGYLIRCHKKQAISNDLFYDPLSSDRTQSGQVCDEKTAVQRHEQTKLRLHAKKRLLASAYQLWWKHALAQYKASHTQILLKSNPMARAMPYYNRVHGGTSSLSSFDDYFSEEYNYPYDASILNVQSAEDPDESQSRTMSFTSADRAASISTFDGSTARYHQESEALDMSDSMTKPVETTAEDDDEAFSLSKFMLNIGAKATKVLKSGISRQRDGVTSSSPDSRTTPFQPNDTHYRMRFNRMGTRGSQNWELRDNTLQAIATKDWGTAGELGSAVVGLCLSASAGQTQRLYAEYEKLGRTPEILIETVDSGRKADFENLIKEQSLSCDDVKGMEALSSNRLVSGVITSSGVYNGLARDASAVDAYFNVFESIVFSESDMYNRFEDVNDVSITNSIVSPIAYDLSVKREFRDKFSMQVELYGTPGAMSEDAADLSPRPLSPVLSLLSDEGRESDASVIEVAASTEQSKKKTMRRVSSAPSLLKQGKADALPRVSSASSLTKVSRDLGVEDLFIRSSSSSSLTPECLSEMNTFLSTPAFVASTNFDASQKYISEVPNFDIPKKAKEALARLAEHREMPAGLENEALQFAAHVVFMHSNYSRIINLPRLSNRMSSLTSYKDFALYLAQFSTDVVMTEWDTLEYLVSIEDSSSKKRQGVEELKEIYSKMYNRYQQNRSPLSSTPCASIVSQVNELLEQKRRLQSAMHHIHDSPGTDSEVESSSDDDEGGGYDRCSDVGLLGSGEESEGFRSLEHSPHTKKATKAFPDWFVSPDFTEEICSQEFHKIQPGIYQKNDNEFFLGNVAAVMSYFTFNQSLDAAEKS